MRKRKFFAIFLAASMAFTGIPSTGFNGIFSNAIAARADDELDVQTGEEGNVQTGEDGNVQTGEDGNENKISYSFNIETGVLTVIGSGDMNASGEYESETDYPWYECADYATKVVIENGVTSISDNAFRGFTNITDVTIPESVTEIGARAFADCTSLTSVTIPKSVTAISFPLVSGCSSLTAINVDKDNVGYCSENGVLFNKNKTELFEYPAGKEDTDYVVPSSVKLLCGYAFVGAANLETVEFPSGLTDMGEITFQDCTGLKSIEIPSGVTEIPMGEFNGCTSLEQVTLPLSITEIKNFAFQNCNAIEKVYYYGMDKDFETIEFNNNKSFKELGFEHLHTSGEAVIENEIEATCNKDGNYDRVIYCEVCGEEIDRDSNILDATGHAYNEDGECEKCGAYQIYVDDVQITSVNADDVTGDGTFSYSNETKTLTIKKDVVYEGERPFVYCENGTAINVVIDKDCTYIDDLSGNETFNCPGGVTITGNDINIAAENFEGPMFPYTSTINATGNVNITSIIGYIGNVPKITGNCIEMITGGNAPTLTTSAQIDATGNVTIISENYMVATNPLNILNAKNVTITANAGSMPALGGTSTINATGDVVVENPEGYLGNITTVTGNNITMTAHDAAPAITSAITIDATGDVEICDEGCMAVSGSLTILNAKDVTVKTTDAEGPTVSGDVTITATGNVLITNDENLAVSGSLTILNAKDVSVTNAAGAPTVSGDVTITATGDVLINNGEYMAVLGLLTILKARNVHVAANCSGVIVAGAINITATKDVTISNHGGGQLGAIEAITGDNISLNSNSSAPMITTGCILNANGDIDISGAGTGMIISGNSSDTATINAKNVNITTSVENGCVFGPSTQIEATGDVQIIVDSEGGYIGNLSSLSCDNAKIVSTAGTTPAFFCGIVINATGDVEITSECEVAYDYLYANADNFKVVSDGLYQMFGDTVAIDCTGDVELTSNASGIGDIALIKGDNVIITGNSSSSSLIGSCNKIIADNVVQITNNAENSAIGNNNATVKAKGFICTTEATNCPTIIGNLNLTADYAEIRNGGYKAVYGKITAQSLSGCKVTLYNGQTVDDMVEQITADKISGYQYSDYTDYRVRIVGSHNYEEVNTVKATTTADGYTENVCDRCGDADATSKVVISHPAQVILSSASTAYTGKAFNPDVTVKAVDGTVISSDNYTVTYENDSANVGTYNVVVTFTGNYSGSLTKTYTVNQAANSIAVAKTSYTYTASASKQYISLGAKDKSGKITYTSSDKSVTVNAAGKVTIPANYSGKVTITLKAGNANYKTVTKKVTITVNPAKVTLSSVSNTAKNAMTVKWSKAAGATGYEIYYSVNSKFTSAKKVTVANASTVSKAISNLTKNKTYYVKVRAYKSVGTTKLYGAYSAVKSVKITK